jgi:hypothetical protein
MNNDPIAEEEDSRKLLRDSIVALRQSKQSVMEMTEQGQGIVAELEQQQSTLQTTKRKIDGINDATRESRSLLRRVEGAGTKGMLVIYLVSFAACAFLTAAMYLALLS